MNTEVTSKKIASLAGKWHLRLAKAIEADGSAALLTINATQIKELQSVCGSALTQTSNKVKAKAKK